MTPELKKTALSPDSNGHSIFKIGSPATMARLPNLNELTTNTNGGTLTVVGSTATFAASVIVNGTNSADLYHDGTFAAPNMPLTTNYTAVAEDSYFRYATNTITVNLSTNVAFQYDANGNLTNDGLRSFAYDDENELIQVWVSNQWKSVFTYDGKMRRRIRQEFTWNGAGWTQTNAVYYVYDGNLVVQERDVNNLPTTTYTRGKDLNGSLEGAGGIGGLLARTSQQYSDAPLAGHSYYHADANGNVTMLINSSQAIVAKYLYDAFGNVLSKAGLLADANVYQFSSKEKDANSGLVYYLYRFYDPNLQRWISRDPNGESGFEEVTIQTNSIPNTEPNRYDFADEDPLNDIDVFGLDVKVQPPNQSPPPGYKKCGQIGSNIVYCSKPPPPPPPPPPARPPKPPPTSCPPPEVNNPNDPWNPFQNLWRNNIFDPHRTKHTNY